jgi:TraL protein
VEGSKAGYEQAKRAADVWAQKERTMSDQLQQCLSRIRQTSITLPSFPSLSDIFNQMVEKICQAAIDEINSHIPSSIDPWEEFKGAVR